MSKEAVFTMKLEPELRDQFMAEAQATHRPASQLVREFMREFVQRQKDARDHAAWMHREIEQGLREADDPTVRRIPHDDVMAEMTRRVAEASKGAG